MPGAPRFTQKPSIQQTPTGDLLMECSLESDPSPSITWHHNGTPLPPSIRCVQTLSPVGASLYKATLVIKEPNADDGGSYKCNAKNPLGETNANINLNFAGGGGDDSAKSRGPVFVGRPRIIPKDGGSLIIMECTVKSASVPTARWMKEGVPLSIGGIFHEAFTPLGDNTYLCQLEIRGPSESDAGQYRCNIKNDQGETNANLALNFQPPDEEPQERKRPPSRSRRSKSPSVKRDKDNMSPRPPSRGPGGSRPGSPKKQLKSREGTPKKSLRSRTSTPTGEMLSPEDARGAQAGWCSDSRRSSKGSDKMEVDAAAAKRKADSGAAAAAGGKEGLPPSGDKRSRLSSPKPGATTTAPSAESNAANAKFKRAPVVVEPALSKSGKSGDRVVIEVEFQCHSSTTISWFKDGKMISSSSSEYSQSWNGNLARLTINRLMEETTGLFKCAANSDYGEAHSSAMVKMEHTDEEYSHAPRDASPPVSQKSSTASRLAAPEPSDDEISGSLMAPVEKKPSEAGKRGTKSKSRSPAPPSRKTSQAAAAAAAAAAEDRCEREELGGSRRASGVEKEETKAKPEFLLAKERLARVKADSVVPTKKTSTSTLIPGQEILRRTSLVPPDSDDDDDVSEASTISEIHSFVLGKLPGGSLREHFEKHIIDYSTARRPTSPSSRPSKHVSAKVEDRRGGEEFQFRVRNKRVREEVKELRSRIEGKNGEMEKSAKASRLIEESDRSQDYQFRMTRSKGVPASTERIVDDISDSQDYQFRMRKSKGVPSSVEGIDDISQIDELPGSGLTIPEERRRQLMGVGEDSEDEMTESISELPSFSQPLQKGRKRAVEVCTNHSSF
ncbi:hypothetical protein PMAYCL1PPCAC_19016, partial [Pristionchus mayeri]